MKVFFASLTQPGIEVDAHVNSPAQGLLMLRALHEFHRGHAVILRARLKQGRAMEERFVGDSNAVGAAEFFERVAAMGQGK